MRADAVCPGFVGTPMADEIFEGAGDGVRECYAATVPLGRFATPDEMAAAVADFTSVEASYTNGLMYVIDGGATAGHFEGAGRVEG
ncbi:SDR family oxidoreductase [Streptomyces sp. NPDC046924]|uniref:SDR family oxidoreductase n=1 Tax=Streptomyces sp. NPDC046924 TaxID=3155136 RepID=UPI0033F7FCE7